MKKKLLLIPILGIALFNTAFGLTSPDIQYIENLFDNVSSCGGCDTAQESCIQYCDMFVSDDPDCSLACNNPYYLSCTNSYCSESSESTSNSIISSDQIDKMGTALVTGGAGLLHIFIQLMPYAIVFTIILLVFGLIKNWSKLKNKGLGDKGDVWFNPKHENFNPVDDFTGEIDVDQLVDELNFYNDDEKAYYPKDSSYKHGRYFKGKKGDVGYYYWYEGKKYTEYTDPEAALIDDIEDKKHHYKKRHGLY